MYRATAQLAKHWSSERRSLGQEGVRVADMGFSEQLSASRELLAHHASNGNHCKTAVVQLLGLHRSQLGGVCGLQADGEEEGLKWCLLQSDVRGHVDVAAEERVELLT